MSLVPAQHEGLTLVPGVTDDNLLPVYVTASFSVAKNDMFVESFDVYLVEGTSPKGAKTIFLGSSTLNFTVGVDGIASDDIEVRGTRTGLLVAAPADMAVEVYDMAGRKVAEGVDNTEISLGAGGVFVVKVANKAFKLMK